MKEIDKAGGKTLRIIKVIDEIAFQTNILALNAAVEAARAGESGPGFDAVAAEVQRLAQRSAQAAKDTAAMIGESVGMSSEGSAKLNQVAEAVTAITESATKVKTLSNEVNRGCQEQTLGMEQVTRKTAASEQLSSHANTMLAAATRLRALVDGGTPEDATSAPRVRRQTSSASNGSKPSAASPKKSQSRIPRDIAAL